VYFKGKKEGRLSRVRTTGVFRLLDDILWWYRVLLSPSITYLCEFVGKGVGFGAEAM